MKKMSQKMIFILLFNISFFKFIKTDGNIDTDIDIDIIGKYGKKEINSQKAILTTSRFKEGEEIYISIKTDYCSNEILNYDFYEYISDSNKESLHALRSVNSKSTSTSKTKSKKTYNFVIEKNAGYGNYLYIIHHCDTPVTIENTEKDPTNTMLIMAILIIVLAFVFFIVFVLVFVCICRRRRRASAYGKVAYQGPSFGASPYVVSPKIIPVGQPVVNVQLNGKNFPPNQDYYGKVQYNQINQGQISDNSNRIIHPLNKQEYEKPK